MLLQIVLTQPAPSTDRLRKIRNKDIADLRISSSALLEKGLPIDNVLTGIKTFNSRQLFINTSSPMDSNQFLFQNFLMGIGLIVPLFYSLFSFSIAYM